ncbi:MAG: SCP2 sterol-binding domain-containing protein [Xanthomonadales bacterium]|nr:SCP2 sterol-binding domain-containing protein [Xanthomonadales bacterium]
MPAVPEFVRPIVRRIIGLPGRALPYSAQRPALSMVLNEAFREPLRHGELEFLEGRRVRIEVTDLCLDWLIQVEADRFRAIDRRQDEDVRISGDALSFVLLATRRADPDTLFFQRRIRVEGDTELGLGVKNTMDSMDWDDLPLPLKRLLRGMGRLIEKLQRLRDDLKPPPKPHLLP